MILRIGVFYILTWFFLLLFGGIQQETGVLPPEIGLAQWAPGFAALMMLLIFRKDRHKIVYLSKETPVSRYVYAALIPLGVGLVVLLIKSFLFIPSSESTAALDSLWLVLLWAPIGALGEELGWRGYLHKKLDTRMRGLFSSLLVGMLWMPIHVHFYSQGVVFLFFLALFMISTSVVIYAVVQDTGFSVILAAIFHLSINLTNLLFLEVIYETSFMMVMATAWVLTAAILILVKKDIFFTRKYT
jgi:membrane protease YdiL (CAAX protease family)